MRIEDITTEILREVSKGELYRLRNNCLQFYNQNFEKNRVQKAKMLKRSDLLEAYWLLLNEIHDRGLKISLKDYALDRAVFRKERFGIDIRNTCEKILIEDFVAISGNFLVIKDVKENQDNEIESKTKEILNDEIRKGIEFIRKTEHLEKSGIPLYDLVLKPKESLRRIDISKPEVTVNYVRIPVGSECEVTATIDISEEKGIKALYCGKEKRIRTYLFDKEKWTMAEAKKWIAEQAFKKLEKGKKEETKKEQEDKSEYFFKFYKQVKKKQMVGGIVYEPNAVDTQGDYTDAEEIQKAMYAFMEKYAKNSKRIKIGHKGTAHTFPIMECFQPEHDIQRGGQTVKKGAWWLMLKVTDKGVWADIEAGKITGFSMGGSAASGK